MAASVHRGDRGDMEDKTQAINAAAKSKTSSQIRPSPYMKRSVIPPATNRTPPSRPSAPTPGARKAKTPSKSPSTTCTSAPAAGTRTPAGEAPEAGTRLLSGGAPAAGTTSLSGGGPAAGTRSLSGGAPAAGNRSLSGGAPAAGTWSLSGGAPAAGTRSLSGGAPAAGTQSLSGGAPAAGSRSLSGGAPAAGTRLLSEGAYAAGTRSLSGGAPAAGTRSLSGGAPAAGTQSLSGGAPAAGTRSLSGGAPTAGTRSLSGGAPAAGTRSLSGGASAAGTRTLSEGAPMLNPSLKAKRGVRSAGAGVVRGGHSAPTIRKEPQMKRPTPHVLIPTKLKRSGLKLLDPEKVKTLTSRLPGSDEKPNVVLRPTTITKAPPRSSRQNLFPRSSARQTESSRKRTGITSRRENIIQSGRTNILQVDERIGGQMDQLLLDDKGCDESRRGDSEVYNGRPPPVQPGGSPDEDRKSGKTVQDGRPPTVQPGGSPDEDRKSGKTVQDGRPPPVQPGGSPDEDRKSGKTVQDGQPPLVQPGGSPDDDRNSGKTVQDGRPPPVHPAGSPDDTRSSGQTVQDGRPPPVQPEVSPDDTRNSGKTVQDSRPPPVQPGGSPDDDRNYEKTVQDCRPSPVQPEGSPDEDRNSGKTVQDSRPPPVQPGGSPDEDRNYGKTVQDGRPPPVQPGGSPHDNRSSGETVQDNAASLEESSVQNDLKSSPVIDNPPSKQTEDMETFIPESTYPQTGDVQERLPGYKESPSQSLPQSQENHLAKIGHPEDPPIEHAQPRCPDTNVVEGSSEEPTSEAQEHCQSSHDYVKDDSTEARTVSLVGENNTLSNSEDDFLGKKSNTPPEPNLPEDQQRATEMGNQEKPNQHVWSRTNDIIRQSQGVLVLTRSTDENAVFVPKLKFEFTPDNSIDWSALGPPPLGNNKGDPTKMKDPRALAACTPRGPTFSKSVMKKTFMSSAQDLPGGCSDAALRFSSAGDVTRNNSHPLAGIVDLSISFQDKFGEQEIPADIPKILLTEEDFDED